MRDGGSGQRAGRGRSDGHGSGRVARRRAVEAFLQIHQREKSGENPLLHFVGERGTDHCNMRQFLRGALHVGSDFGPARRAASAYDRLSAHPGAGVIHADENVKYAEVLGFELGGHSGMAAGKAVDRLAVVLQECPQRRRR